MLKKLHRNGKGFTLIELMIVIAIIAILAAIAIPNFMTARRKARISADQQQLSSYATALEVYAVDEALGDGSYPTAATSLVALVTALRATGSDGSSVAMRNANVNDLGNKVGGECSGTGAVVTRVINSSNYELCINSIEIDGDPTHYTWTAALGRSWE